MQEGDKIDSLFDYSAIEKEQKDVNGLLNTLANQINKFPAIRLKIEGTESLKGFYAATNEMKKAQSDLATSTQLLKIKSLELDVAKKELTLQSQKEKEASRQLTETRKQEANETKKAAIAAKALSSQRAEGARSAAAEQKIIDQAANEYFQLGQALKDAELRYKNLALTQGLTNKQTQVALKEALSIRNVLDQVDKNLNNYQRNVGNYGSAFNGLGNSFQQVLREAPAAAVSLNTFFLAISNNLPILFDEILKLKAAQKAAAAEALVQAAAAKEQAIANAIATGATEKAAAAQGLLAEETAIANAAQAKAPSVLKQIASSLFSLNTFLTLSVLALTLFGGKVVEFAKSLFRTADGTKALAEQNKLLNTVLADASKTAGKETADLKILYNATQDVTLSTELRTKAAKELQKEYPTTFKNLSTEEILLGNAKKGYDELTQSILKTALARAAQSQLEELGGQRINAEFQRSKIIGTTAGEINRAKSRTLSAGGGGGMSMGTGGQDVVISKQEQVNDIIKRRNSSLKQQDDILAEITRKENFLIGLVGKGALVNAIVDDGAKGDKTGVKTLADRLKAVTTEFERYKIIQQDLISLNDEQAGNEKVSYEARQAALKEFLDHSKELILKQAEFDKSEKQKEVAREIDNLQKDKVGKSPDQIARINANILTIQRNLAQELSLIDTKTNSDSLKLYHDTSKKKEKIDEDHKLQLEKDRKEAYEKQLADAGKLNNENNTGLANQYASDIEDLNYALAAKLISLKDFNAAKQDIDFKYHMDAIQEEIRFAEAIIAIQKTFGFDVSKQEQALAELRIKLDDLVTAHLKENGKTQGKTDEQIAARKKELYKQLYYEIGETLKQFHLDNITREEQELDEKQRLLDKETTKRINNINMLGLSESERVRLVATEEKRAAFQSEVIEKRKRQLAYERAKFEKASNIAQIITSTALAVIKELQETPGPKGFVLAGIVAAIGALQLARAASAPLPKYRDGRKATGVKEWAITGDGGVPEFIKRGDGSMDVTPSRPTLTHLGPDDIVYKNQQAFLDAALANGLIPNMNDMFKSLQPKAAPANEMNTKLLKKIHTALEKKTPVYIHNERGIESSEWFQKNIRG